jgi:hypothetical protein
VAETVTARGRAVITPEVIDPRGTARQGGSIGSPVTEIRALTSAYDLAGG